LKKDHGFAYELCGCIQYRLGHIEEAASDCEQALKLKSETGLVYDVLGLIELKRHAREKALAHFSEPSR